MEKSNDKPQAAERMPFSRKNYIAVAIGVAIIVVGFVLMSGGGNTTAEVFDYSMFSWRRIGLAPIVVLVGFGVEVFAIMHRFKDKKGER